MTDQKNDMPQVFIVHGHDMATLTRLELILHRIGAEPVTLRKAPKPGSATLIELLEKYAPKADAVIVLMTPDDEGRKRNSDEDLQPRARENVLVEAGYAVISRRDRSLLLALEGVSIPSDFDGIHRIQSEFFDSKVQFEVAKRLKDMGLDVDVSGAA
jgi:predicted nucleotide-binding protein